MQSTSACGWSKKGAVNSDTNQDIGLSRGGKNTKIHALVDALGNPVVLYLSAGNINDCVVAVDVLKQAELKGSIVMGDKAYGTSDIREYIESEGGTHLLHSTQGECQRPVGVRLLSV